PNVTAILHVGHGLNNVIQDVLIRFERMRGREAEWLPGTDHAGIATQNVVERLLADEGKTRFDLGRDKFVERVWAFVRETGNTILEQLKVIGCSCDWSRTRFTLDDAYSGAVREAFVRLWEEKLTYRGHRVIHWCPHCLTALSDEEAESKDTEGKLYYIRYAVEGGPQPFLTVATTRPETLLGDTAVAVNPKDARHAGFVGKVARLPIADISIPIVADEAVDPTFGTGFVKVTPAHDATDFDIGLRHKLEMPLVMTEAARMEHIRDWNISRQLWWGHRITVFTCTKCKHQWADRNDPTTCPKCGGPVEQDPDVLDTWFSSWLWPFATFGWPERTPDLARFYPGHTLVTAPEILFFWVARMLMSGYQFMDDHPFATVYLHGTVRDTQHGK